MIRRICLFGGPGCGKSTMAADVFVKLKKSGYSIELINEYIKSWAYEKKQLQTFDQVYIFAKQQRLEDRVLRTGVNHIVTDSPLFLQCFYAAKHQSLCSNELLSIAKTFEQMYSSINVFVKRNQTPYQQQGRYETENQAIEIDFALKNFLNFLSIPFIEVDNADTIIDRFNGANI